MIRAYHETYLDGAMQRTGDMFDYATNECGLSGDDFIRRFICSDICSAMERGEPAYISGKSGVELAMEILGGDLPVPKKAYDRSPAHWCGWISAYYQWWSNRKYEALFQAVPFSEMIRLYRTLHEADIEKAAGVLDARVRNHFPDTNLKRLRLAYGCSQGQLARRSGVSLRSIQMYEQRNKDINKAHAETVLRLSKTLGCSMEELIEAG